MNIKSITRVSILTFAACVAIPAMVSCSNQSSNQQNTSQDSALNPKGKGAKPGGPQLGTPGGGPVIDKSGDETLQAMIKSEVPEFKQLEYDDAKTGKTIKYNLFTPKNIVPSKKYPVSS